MATVVLAAFSRLSASISVEQIEAFETDTGDNSSAPTRYAPIDFSGASQVKPTSGQYAGITFHALGGTTTTNSDHAGVVANIIFGKDSVSYPYISDVYNIPATTFFTSVIQTTDALSATGPLPGHFATGVKVVDNGYAGASPSNLDVIRRLDYMINQDDVTFVAAASNTANAPTGLLAWSSYNALAVSGQGTFTPIYSPEKKHADLSGPGLTSFTEAAVASNSATLFGQAQIVNQTDAMHSVVNRSLLMAGTDKTSYSPRHHQQSFPAVRCRPGQSGHQPCDSWHWRKTTRCCDRTLYRRGRAELEFERMVVRNRPCQRTERGSVSFRRRTHGAERFAKLECGSTY